MQLSSVTFFQSGGPGKRIYDLMLELVAIPGITGSPGGENECARFIHDRLAKLDYFRQNPLDLRFLEVENDPLKRLSICALVRSGRATEKTVILTGHFDVVDVDVCGPLRSWAFEPEEYTRRIAALNLPEDARKDLDSGNWIFGRGVSDMKTGVAIDICLFEEYAAEHDRLDMNILLLLVPDEEGDSEGMRSAISVLAKLQTEEGLDFLACVNPEPVFEASSPAIFYGTIGKIMPLFLCVGRESHVGEYYEGLNSALIASYLNIALDGAKDIVEKYGKQSFQPWACLHMRDLRSRYAVTLPERTVLYYNCLTVGKTPTAVLEEMKARGMHALSSAIAHIGRTDLMPRVLTVEEVLTKAAEVSGKSLRELVEDELPRIFATDERDRNIEFLSRALDLTGEKGPLVVVGFVPPFYPPRSNDSRNVYEQAVRHAASEVRVSLEKRGYAFEEIEIFQGITDLSYTGFQGRAEEIEPLAANIPLWGHVYSLPVADLQKIDIPSVVLGPLGKDSHKITERVELDFSFNVFPAIMKEFVASIVRRHGNRKP